MIETTAGFLRRAAAYLIDIVLLYLYIIVLFAVSTGVDSVMPFHHLMGESYLIRHAVSLATLTLPTVLYFTLMEGSARQATLGKSRLKLRVVAEDGGKASTRAVLVRNAVKFLPWEIAHTHIHINPEFLMTGQTSLPGWVLGVGLPITALCVYAGMILLRSDHRSLYELISGTRTVRVFADATRTVR